MHDFKHPKNHGHGHHKHKDDHKKERKHWKKLGKHMEKELKHRGRFLRRCLSESDLPNIASENQNVEEQIRQIVTGFFRRRHHWARAMFCNGKNDRNGEAFNQETDKETTAEANESGNTSGDSRWMRHHGGHHHHTRGHARQGRTTDDSSSEGKEMDKGNHHHGHHHHGVHGKRHHGHGFRRGRHQGRSSENKDGSSSDASSHGRKNHRHHHHGMRHERDFRKHFGGWKRHGWGVTLADASTMTDDVTMQEVSVGGADVKKTGEDTQMEIRGPASPEIEEVANNLRDSSLEGPASPRV